METIQKEGNPNDYAYLASQISSQDLQICHHWRNENERATVTDWKHSSTCAIHPQKSNIVTKDFITYEIWVSLKQECQDYVFMWQVTSLRSTSSTRIKSDLHITIICSFFFLLAVAVPFPTMVHFCITKKLKNKRESIKEITF